MSEIRRLVMDRRMILIMLLRRENIKGDDIVWLHELSSGCRVVKGNFRLHFHFSYDYLRVGISDIASGDLLFDTKILIKGIFVTFFHITMEYIRSTFLEERDADEADAGGAGGA